jgi:amino acid transporter
MLSVALVFGELSSEYPLSGALYQYGKYNVNARYGWFVGWIYGFALLATVASADTGAVGYICTLLSKWGIANLNPASNVVIVVITVVMVLAQFLLNAVGAKVMGRVARFGVYVETIGTFGVFIALAWHFHHGVSYVFTTQGVTHAATNPLGVNFGGHWLTGAALVAVLANVYIFFGFESAGDIAEETIEATRQVPKAMRNALIYGGVASFVLVLGLLLATPKGAAGMAAVAAGGVTSILAQLPGFLQDFFLIMVIVAFFSCGTAVQGAGARVAFALSRDHALPGSAWIRRVSPNQKTPVNALVIGAVVPILFALLVAVKPPAAGWHILWFDYPAGVNALFALVSFATSGIYLSFLLTCLGALIARLRGWKPAGQFQLGKWGLPVTIFSVVYLGLMLLNIVWPSALTSGRAMYFNFGWVTLAVMFVIVVVGALYEAIARPDRKMTHTHTSGKKID